MSDVCLLCYLWTYQIFRCYFPHFLFCFFGAYWLSVFVVLSPLHLYPLCFSPLKKPNSSPSAIHPLSSRSLLSCLQWRVSGWSGGRGRSAAWRATRGPSSGRGAAARQSTAGPSVRAFTRRAENAPTLPAAVRSADRCFVFKLTRSPKKKKTLCKHGKCIWSHLHALLLNLVPYNSVAICWRRPGLACVWVSLYPAGPKE